MSIAALAEREVAFRLVGALEMFDKFDQLDLDYDMQQHLATHLMDALDDPDANPGVITPVMGRRSDRVFRAPGVDVNVVLAIDEDDRVATFINAHRAAGN